MKKALITGITGQDGSYLAELLLAQGYQVTGMVRRASTETFDRIAETIRERTRIEGRIRALTAMGRLQGIVVGLIPIFLLVVLTLMDPKMMMSFYGSTTGVMLLCLMVLLEAIGFYVIKKIVNIRV